MPSDLYQHWPNCHSEGVFVDEINTDGQHPLVKQTAVPNVGGPHPIR